MMYFYKQTDKGSVYYVSINIDTHWLHWKAVQSTPSVPNVVETLGGILLGIGGHSVAAVNPLEKIGYALIDKGVLVEYKKVVYIRGDENACHENTAFISLKSPGRTPMSGYALSEGIWRKHSWLLSKYKNLVETTSARDLYFGVQVDRGFYWQDQSLALPHVPPSTLPNGLTVSAEDPGTIQSGEMKRSSTGS
jgi:hypothetical protein